MPIIYRCSKRGSIITVYSEGTWYGTPSSDIVKYIGDKCPVCGQAAKHRY